MATVGAVARLRAQGFDWGTDVSALPFLGMEGITLLQFGGLVVWANFVSIAVFAGLLAGAVVLRRHAAAHKRLMVLASIAIVAPALARIARWPIFGGEDSAFVPAVLLGLLLAVVVHDLVAARRLHRATLIGCGAIVAGAVAQQLLARSEFGLAVVRMLG